MPSTRNEKLILSLQNGLETLNQFRLITKFISSPLFPATGRDPPDGAWINGFPPLISAVCRESRSIVLESGRFPERFAPDGEEGPGWRASTSYVTSWLDPARDRVHLNWTPAYAADFCNNSDDDGSPLEYLAWRAAQLTTSSPAKTGRASFMDDWLYVSDNATPPPVLREILSRFACWQVIVRGMAIHADRRTGAESGLFGLLGDAPVQIVDVSDHGRVEAYWRLAEAQRRYDPHEQDFERVEAEAVDREVQAQVKKICGDETLPAIENCETENQPETSKDFLSQFKEARERYADTLGPSGHMNPLDACVKEALRLHPPFCLPFERIVPSTGMTVSGRYLPLGTTVGMRPWVINRNSEVFGEDADMWRPERWLSDAHSHAIMEKNMHSFGAGRCTM
ncbi:hypothetical protein ASPACDRAFT_46434 [Aspergillus aculeatus ATCC 16872]|uniref:Cytochrome P450 n=1 Tax=Aspergillus aculeatus (strain ATCC 16872 / CBS 172.66 / WB 5094) TaxID=690307 RepID=A0A1L9WL72_ASPA1|nr:uncharacterized protein ASPACDRAFT_46434 [Aspergillus aculeatus ATCC 16872]OJJ96908.1 hypothetical protein ASPACDRAFT_46434 [Aspergillus aculeatus ATCC 16872]